MAATDVLDIETVSTHSELREVIQLAKRSSGTLGFLRNEAFADRLRHNGIVIAKVNGVVKGYILYDLPRKGHIKLVHVCVDPAARGKNIASRMMQHVIRLNPRANGVYAACRDDYEIDEFWVKLGLTPKRRIPGRAVKGSVLVQWWRQLGPLDLFESAIASTTTPVAVLDTNVIADLFGSMNATRATREESLALLTSWVADAVSFSVSTAVDIENNRNPDKTEAQHRYLNSEHLPRLRTTRPDDRELEDAILRRFGHAALERDPSLKHDTLHLADAIRNGAHFFVTHDEGLIAAAGDWIAVEHGLRIMRPHQLVAELAASTSSGPFRTRLIETVDLEWELPSANTSAQTMATLFQATERGEALKALTRRIRECVSRSPSTTFTLTDGSRPLALLSFSVEPDALHIHVLRVRRRRVGPTLALQIARHLREVASDQHRSRIVVSLDAIDETTRQGLLADGFNPHGNELVGLVGPSHLTLDEARAWAAAHGYVGGSDATTLERSLWPLVIVDADIPTYVIPIHPRFAESLFGYQTEVLFHQRKRALGLSREHVYFHAAGSASIGDHPARLLWYVTADGTTASRSFAVVSRTIDDRTLPADTAHHMFTHLGTLTRNQVRSVANKKGDVHVIRFEDSHVLPRPVSGSELKAILNSHQIKGNLQSLRRVPAAFFSGVLRASWGSGA